MTIIPAIDILGGKCVRLTRGDYDQKTIYNKDPLEVAREFENEGIRRLHLVDLDGAKTGEVKNWKTLEQIAARTKLVIDFSGGIRTRESIEISIQSGAFYTAIGSIAAKDEQTTLSWLQEFGPKRFIICADVKNSNVVISGWQKSIALSVFDLIGRYYNNGVTQFLCTDVSKDGMLQGPAFDLYENILLVYSRIHLLASGGISSPSDLEKLKRIGCGGAIVGKAIYENKIKLIELKERF